MKFMLLICAGEGVELSEEERRALPDIDEWVDQLTRSGQRLYGNELAGVSDATSLRIVDGETVVADGPFAETKEFIAGFDILECASIEEAVEIAARHPVAHFGAVEVRPFHPDFN